ncbi:MAG: RDD family protein [Saprospiraceae bacterium]|nr:RDD family protein [Saprospiraceae bacterium]
MTILDQPVPQTVKIEYASFGERVIARLIDGFILLVPSMFLPIIFPWLYFATQEASKSGATIGKRAMHIRVLSVEGQNIGFGTATGRFLANFLNIFTLFFGYLLMLFNARSQCLHDMITSTVVVKDRPEFRNPSTVSAARQPNKKSWSAKSGETDTYFVEINPDGGRFWRRNREGEQVEDFTLWQLTDGKVNYSAEFGPEAYGEMQQFAEQLLRMKA